MLRKNIYIFLACLVLSVFFIACDSKSGKEKDPIDKIEEGEVRGKDKDIKPTGKQFEFKDKLLGIWLKTNEKGNGYEGFNFKQDYTLELENIYYTIGDKWEIDGDTVITWTHTDKYPDPEPTKYFIQELTDSVLVVAELRDTVKVHKEIYRKKK